MFLPSNNLKVKIHFSSLHLKIFYAVPRFYSTDILRETNLYSILGVLPTATHKEIKHSFYAKSKLYHPDVSNDPASQKIFHKVAKAYEVLGNFELRRNYDKNLYKPTSKLFEEELKYKYHVYKTDEVVDKNAYTEFTSYAWSAKKLNDYKQERDKEAHEKSLISQYMMGSFLIFVIGGLLYDRFIVCPSILPNKIKI